MTTSNAFELGFCLGGSVSAGAYQAGVIDFLFEALDAWEEAKRSNPNATPPHQVSIKVIGGTSGGGICAGLWAVHSGWKFEHPRGAIPPAPGRNPFYDTWVRHIDMTRFLETQDLQQGRFSSLLDCTVLNEIAKVAFDRPQGALPVNRAYFGDPTHLFLTNTNLRGVPYRIRMRTEAGEAGNDLRLHADYVRFAVGSRQITKPGITWFDPRLNQIHAAARDKLANAALATSAFPLALAPRLVSQELGTYGERVWYAPAEQGNSSGSALEPVAIDPAWPPFTRATLEKDGAYHYWAVDGGVLNNEPLELVRQFLAGGPDLRNPRDPLQASRMTILLDPFVAEIDELESAWMVDKAEKYQGREPFGHPGLEPNLVDLLGGLVGGLRKQANFKPQELALAHAEDVYSRFLVAPVREDAQGNRILHTRAIACGLLGGFGGFLDESLRRHDYLLGRRNCQQFLRRAFALEIRPDSINPRFGVTAERAIAANWAYQENGRTFLPIIPLLGEAAVPLPAPDWPSLSRKSLKGLSKQLKKRLNALAPKLKDLAPNKFLGILLSKAVDWGDDAIQDFVKETVLEAIQVHRFELKE